MADARAGHGTARLGRAVAKLRGAREQHCADALRTARACTAAAKLGSAGQRQSDALVCIGVALRRPELAWLGIAVALRGVAKDGGGKALPLTALGRRGIALVCAGTA